MVGFLTSFVNGNTREAAQKNVVNCAVIQDLVRWKGQAVLDFGHDLCCTLVVQRKNAIENSNLVGLAKQPQSGFAYLIITKGLFTFTVELKERLELGLLVTVCVCQADVQSTSYTHV